MSNEPMFNIEERAPLWLGGVFILIHAVRTYGPEFINAFIAQWSILVPFDMPGAAMPRQITSSVLSGFIHASWSHALVNTGMLVAFAVITYRGLRARQSDRTSRDLHNLLPANAFFLLIFLAGVAGGSLFQWGWWALVNTESAAAIGASGGASALFATAAWAIGGRQRLIMFGMGWALLNIVFVVAEPLLGPIAWAAHLGGYAVGAMLAPYWVKPFSTGFSITR